MTYKKFYLLSVIGIILISVYPLYMGIVTLGSYLRNGSINVTDYQKYIIPYTPICIGLIASVVLMPLIFKLFNRYTLRVASFLGTALFIASEFGFEQIKVVEGNVRMPLESWQLSLCIATPEVLRSVGKPIYAMYNPAFKIHFYIIAIVIILAVLNIVHGFSKMLIEKDFSRKRLMTAQSVFVLLFISLCILACFTAFYRNGTINISPLSAMLMSAFFIVFGITGGIYCGLVFYRKGRMLSMIIPAITASLTTLIMYAGELVLMGGVLFKYGKGSFFAPIGASPFSAADIAIILVSGVITYIVMLCTKTENCLNKHDINEPHFY